MEDEYFIYDDDNFNNPLNLLDNKKITYKNLEKLLCKLNYNELIKLNSYRETPLMHLCKNESITYEILELFISYLNPIDLISKDKLGDTALLYLCVNISITYEILELFISKLTHKDLILQNEFNYTNDFHTNKTALMVLCRNPYITYEILELFISRLYPEDLYKKDKINKCALNYLVENNNIFSKIEYYKLFINKTILKEDFIEIIGDYEYILNKLEIDDYFEIVNNYYDLK